MTDSPRVRPAHVTDSAAIAALLVEGFGHDYGGPSHMEAVQRMMQRIHALPGRLRGMYVAVDGADTPIGMAGLRSLELRPASDWPEEHITLEELGFTRTFWLELRAELVEPRTYRIRADEGFIYGVVVTAAWRGRGIGELLLTTLHAEAWNRGKRRMLLEVVANNTPAVHLYRRLGYQVVKRRRGLLSFLRLGVPPRLLMARTLEERMKDEG